MRVARPLVNRNTLTEVGIRSAATYSGFLEVKFGIDLGHWEARVGACVLPPWGHFLDHSLLGYAALLLVLLFTAFVNILGPARGLHAVFWGLGCPSVSSLPLSISAAPGNLQFFLDEISLRLLSSIYRFSSVLEWVRQFLTVQQSNQEYLGCLLDSLQRHSSKRAA